MDSSSSKSESVEVRTVVFTHPDRLHARAAVAISDAVRESNSLVAIIRNGNRIKATDVLQLLTMFASKGERVQVEAIGPDASVILDTVCSVLVEWKIAAA